MIRQITRQPIFDTYETITSTIVRIQKDMFDTEPLFEDGDDGEWYFKMYDAIDIPNREIKRHSSVLSFHHSDISTFTTVLAEKLTKLLTQLNISDLIVIAHLKLSLVGNSDNMYLPFQKAIKRLKDITNDLKYDEVLKISLTDLPILIEIIFWITRCDAGSPQYIYFFDVKESIAFNICKSGGIHIIEYDQEIIFDELIESLDMYFVNGHCDEKFSAGSKIEGRQSSKN